MIERTLLSRFVYSRLNYWGSLIGDVAMPLVFLGLGIFFIRSTTSNTSKTFVVAVLALLAGWLFWSILEYILHRYVLHGSRTLAQQGHAEHHRDELLLIASPLFIIPVVEGLIWAVLFFLLGPTLASFFVTGAAAGYTSFSLLHHAFHHGESARWPMRGLCRNHEVHHQLAGWNFGTTTSLWDRVLGTYRSPDSLPNLDSRTVERRSNRQVGSRG